MSTLTLDSILNPEPLQVAKTITATPEEASSLTFNDFDISASLKADSVPERALYRAMIDPNHLILSQEVEDEYREVLFRPNSIVSCPLSGGR